MSELSELDQGFIELVTPPDQNRSAHGMYVEFYMHPVEDKAKSLEEGRPIHKEVPYIMIMSPGNKTSVIRRPVQTGSHPKNDNNRFHNEYIAFHQGLMAPIEGTPLEQWSQITRSQVLDLQHFGIKTVEHLANLNDSNAGQYMGLTDMKTKAKNYLEATAGEAPLIRMQAELDERDGRIDTLDNVIKEMREELNEMKTGRKKKE